MELEKDQGKPDIEDKGLNGFDSIYGNNEIFIFL